MSDDKSDDTTVARRRLVRSDASGIAVQVSLLVGAVLILGLAIWAVERAVQDVQWGNVAEWVGGVGTVGALLAAVVVFQGDTEARQAETARREQDDDDRRREQASRVTGLVVDLPRTSPTGEDPPSRLTALAQRQRRANLRRSGPRVRCHQLPARRRLQLPTRATRWSSCEPRHRTPARRSRGRGWVVAVQFNDSNGRRWSREADGRLVRLGHAPHPSPTDDV